MTEQRDRIIVECTLAIIEALRLAAPIQLPAQYFDNIKRELVHRTLPGDQRGHE